MRIGLKGRAVVAAWGLGVSGAAAGAYEVRIRFVERVGNTDTVLPGNTVDFSAGFSRRIRMQVGVFDDANGPAPAGGIVGWINGEIDNSGLIGMRTPGRLTLFAFPEGGNGSPSTDPFFHIEDINAVLQLQTLEWGCNGANPGPMPTPVIRGRNTFISVWETTFSLSQCLGDLRAHFSGQVVVASGWAIVGVPTPPSCSAPPAPGSVVYAPLVEASVPFNASLYGGMGFPNHCMSDWNRDQQLTSEDFFLFLADFFAGSADFNCDGVANTDDFFGFLAEFFAGC